MLYKINRTLTAFIGDATELWKIRLEANFKLNWKLSSSKWDMSPKVAEKN